MARAGLLHVPDFHRNAFINYQLLRLVGEGYADEAEVRGAALRVQLPREMPQVFGELSRKAEEAGRLQAAAFYARTAEFFTEPRGSERKQAYLRFRHLFDRAFAHLALERHEVDYDGAALPALRKRSLVSPPLGTVLVFGGFDSLIEEFVAIWSAIAEAGFDVIAFDGPGQGGARALHGLVFDHDWEKPVAAMLDYFRLSSASLVGISMGGYWALRAAAHEKRIRSVVSWPPVYDWLAVLPSPVRPLVRWMARHEGFMRWSIRLRMRLSPLLRYVVEQALYIQDESDEAKVATWFLGMNQRHLGSERVTRDVLLLAGAADRFQSPRLAAAQARALIRARSVTHRIFTAEENAADHCQMGNLSLATQVVTDWLKRT